MEGMGKVEDLEARLARAEEETDAALQAASALADEAKAQKRRAEDAEAAIARVTALHTPGRMVDVWGKSNSKPDDFPVCTACSDVDNWWCEWPCLTMLAVNPGGNPTL